MMEDDVTTFSADSPISDLSSTAKNSQEPNGVAGDVVEINAKMIPTESKDNDNIAVSTGS